jgi:hypothetical protein
MLRPDRLESLLSSMQLSMDELLKADPAGNLLKQEDPLANGFKEDPEGNFLKNLHRNEVNLTRLLNQQGRQHRRRGRHGGAGAGARRGRGAPDAAPPMTAAGAADTNDADADDDASTPMMDLYPRAPIDAWDSFPDDPRFPHGHTEHVHSHLGQGDHEDHTNAPPPPPGMQRDVRGGDASPAAANTEVMPGMDMGMEHAMGASSDSMGHTSSSSSSPAQPTTTPVDQHGRRRRALLEDSSSSSSTSSSSTGGAPADPGAVCNGVNEPIPPLPEPEPSSSSSSSSSTGDDGSSSSAVDGGQTGANTGPDDGGVISRPSSAEPTQRRTVSSLAMTLLVALMAVAGAMRM